MVARRRLPRRPNSEQSESELQPVGATEEIHASQSRHYPQKLVVHLMEQTNMAKKPKDGQNKSQAIRKYKAAKQSASPKEVAESLSKAGMTVTAQFVSTVLSNVRKKGSNVGKRSRKPSQPAATTAAPSSNIQHLIKAKKLVDQLGGVAEARAAIRTLAQILG